MSIHFSYLKKFNQNFIIDNSLGPSVESSEEIIESPKFDGLSTNSLIVDDNYNRIDDSLEEKMIGSGELVRIIVFLNQTANIIDFKTFIEQNNITIISSGQYPVPFYSFISSFEFIQDLLARVVPLWSNP